MANERKRYRAWFTPNPPGPAFTVETDSLRDAERISDAITRFALHLGEELIAVSAGGVEFWDASIEDWSMLDGDETYCEVCGLDRDADYLWGDPDDPTVEPMHASPLLPQSGHHEYRPVAPPSLDG